MTDLKQRLRNSDPVQHEGPLRADDRDRMRRAILSAPVFHAAAWPRPWLVAAGVAAAVTAGAVAGTRLPHREVPATLATAPGEPDVRQVQFETKGGTRVIWILNPSFDLGKEPAP
jgi:hypothetical protein